VWDLAAILLALLDVPISFASRHPINNVSQNRWVGLFGKEPSRLI
jgi:hypothetical protein